MYNLFELGTTIWQTGATQFISAQCSNRNEFINFNSYMCTCRLPLCIMSLPCIMFTPYMGKKCVVSIIS